MAHPLRTTALAVALAGATLLPGPASIASDSTATTDRAAPVVIVSSSDPHGDVRLFRGTELTPREKKSIDLHDVIVRRTDAGVQVVVTMRKVIRRPRFDQMIFIRMREDPGTVGGPWTYEGGFTTKNFLGYSTYANEDFSDYETCGLPVVVKARKRKVVATLPARCTPTGDVRIRLWSLTGTFRSDAPVLSRDVHGIPGYFSLGGAMS